jgi:opacity protein-like surface antigen
MMKATFVFALLLLVCSVPVFAQAPAGTIRLGVGVEGGVPSGDFSNAANFGIGGLAVGMYDVDQNLTLTLTAGYMKFSGKDFVVNGQTIKTDLSAVPVLVGARYYLIPPGDMRVYGQANLGMYFLSASASTTVSGTNISASTSESKFGFSPILGAEFKAGEKMCIDVHANYTSISTDPSSTAFIGFGAGIVFGLQ